MAESGGFEPPVQLSPYNGLANRRLQPLGQLSGGVAGWDVFDYSVRKRAGIPLPSFSRKIFKALGLGPDLFPECTKKCA